MKYQLDIFHLAEDEIYEQALYYQGKFSSGQEDFISAVSDTLEKIEKNPEIGKLRFPEKDLTIRSQTVKMGSETKGFARNFPFELVYKIDSQKQSIIIYQLWPIRSSNDFRDPPS